MESDNLRLSLVYETDEEHNIRSCTFSRCGQFFAFSESPQITAVYRLPTILDVCTAPQTNGSFQHVSANGVQANKESDWHLVSVEPESERLIPIDLPPVRRIVCAGPINCLTFAHGDLEQSRLPHRRSKRVSRLIQHSKVTLLLFGLGTGRIEIYNVCDFTENGARMPNLSLHANHLPIFALAAHTDDSLRVASVHFGGEVMLWDLWDDGNMYASLRTHFSFPISLSEWDSGKQLIAGEAYTFAWQPHGDHICLAGEHGWGVILKSEKPFDRVAALYSGHCHRICAARYTNDSSLLLTASYDSCTAVWSVPEYILMHRFWHLQPIPSLLLLGGSNGHHLYDIALSPDGQRFTTICEDGRVRLWNLSYGKSPLKTYPEVLSPGLRKMKFRSVACSPCGRLISVSSSDNRVLLFTTSSHRISLKLQCMHVIRASITRRLTKLYPNQLRAHGPPGTATSGPPTAININLPSATQLDNLHFSKAVSQLPLPFKLRLRLLRHFATPIDTVN